MCIDDCIIYQFHIIYYNFLTSLKKGKVKVKINLNLTSFNINFINLTIHRPQLIFINIQYTGINDFRKFIRGILVHILIEIQI